MKALVLAGLKVQRGFCTRPAEPAAMALQPTTSSAAKASR